MIYWVLNILYKPYYYSVGSYWFYAFMKNGLKCTHIKNNSRSMYGRAGLLRIIILYTFCMKVS